MSTLENLKNRFTNTVFSGNRNKRTALEKAYADMSRRATGHKSHLKETCINWLLNEVFIENFSFDSQEAFNVWHKNTCLGLKSKMGSFGTIGRAQKVINMAFKYLSCLDGAYNEERFNQVFQFCHMTLDGYTLNWYETFGDLRVIWSKIDDYDEYARIKEEIREHLSECCEYSIKIGERTTQSIEVSATPFLAEFIIWEGEIINSKYNSLIKQLNEYNNGGKDKDAWLVGDLMDSYL